MCQALWLRCVGKECVSNRNIRSIKTCRSDSLYLVLKLSTALSLVKKGRRVPADKNRRTPRVVFSDCSIKPNFSRRSEISAIGMALISSGSTPLNPPFSSNKRSLYFQRRRLMDSRSVFFPFAFLPVWGLLRFLFSLLCLCAERLTPVAPFSFTGPVPPLPCFERLLPEAGFRAKFVAFTAFIAFFSSLSELADNDLNPLKESFPYLLPSTVLRRDSLHVLRRCGKIIPGNVPVCLWTSPKPSNPTFLIYNIGLGHSLLLGAQ